MKQFKKHIVVEKPMALKVTDAEEMIKVAKDNNVQLHVVHQNRFNKATKKLKELCDENAFGKKSIGTVRLRWARGQGYYDRDAWRGTWALDGGALTNQAIHHIDLLNWCVGEIESVSANSSTRLVNVEVEDTAVAWVKFKDGTLGVIEAMTSVRPDDLEASVSIMGENGSIIVEGTSVNKFSYSSFTKEDLNQYSEFPPNVYGFGHDHFMKTVIDAVNGKADPVIPGEEGIKAVKLLNAIYNSIETGKTVYLRDNPVSSKLGVFTEKTLPIKALYTTEKRNEYL
jgi:predicted dehydrogenase